ncbi:hypothetical protein BC332_14093 [Capsicum chinense]|nr:hypothetical protein BC332_14093 [Capsicum chinense]
MSELFKQQVQQESNLVSRWHMVFSNMRFGGRRAEIDRLTELLRSKTVDTPAGDDKSIVAAPITSSRVPKRNAASPAGLARAYMGTRPSKASPSILSLQSQFVRDTPLLKNAAYSQNLRITSVTANTAGVVGVRANGFTTPRYRGRSAIYHMAPTPYSRLLERRKRIKLNE